MENLRFRHGMWLVNTLLNYKKLNREELNKLWVNNVDLSGGEELTRNQLNRAISSALDVLGVSIECDVKDRYRYYISGDNSLKATELMLSSFSINQLMTEGGNLRSKRFLPANFFCPLSSKRCQRARQWNSTTRSFPIVNHILALSNPTV